MVFRIHILTLGLGGGGLDFKILKTTLIKAYRAANGWLTIRAMAI